MKQYERVSDVAETEVLWRSDFQSGSRVKNLFFCINMTFIVISFKKIVTNNQTLKLADFTCNLGFGHSKLPESRVPLCSLIWYEAKILRPKESIGFKNLVHTREYTNHTGVLINILYPTQCHEFHLIWCDISKSHCEEDPSNYAGLEKRNNCRRWKRFFVPLIKFFSSHGSADMGTFCFVFYV